MGSGSSSARNVATKASVAVQAALAPLAHDDSSVLALEARIKQLETENAQLKDRVIAAPSACATVLGLPLPNEQRPRVSEACGGDVTGRPRWLRCCRTASPRVCLICTCASFIPVPHSYLFLIHAAGSILPSSGVLKRTHAQKSHQQEQEQSACARLLHTRWCQWLRRGKFDANAQRGAALAPIAEVQTFVPTDALFELIAKNDEDGIRRALLQGADPNAADRCSFLSVFHVAFQVLISSQTALQPRPFAAVPCSAQEARWLHPGARALGCYAHAA